MTDHAGNTDIESRIGVKSPEDVVIVSALRTPLTKAKRGGFKDTKAIHLLASVLKGVVEKVGLEKGLVEDVAAGTVCAPNGGASLVRMAVLDAGFPVSVGSMAINRQCSSGLQAIVQISSAIRDETISIGIAAGFESMSEHYGNARFPLLPSEFDEEIYQEQYSKDATLPTGVLSEIIADDFNVSREKQDKHAVHSHDKAHRAQVAGWFKDEILPVKTKIKNKDGVMQDVVISDDDGIRPGTTLESLAKLKSPFKKGGSTTAGNSSQLTDGAAAVLLMRRSKALELGLPILGKYITSACCGINPRHTLIGLVHAIPLAVKRAGISIDDVDIFEVNEAFASQFSHTIDVLGLDFNKINPRGGAMALGHPMGCTGARQLVTLLSELKRQSKKIGAVTMCIGTGMGMCAIFENEQ
ncbi:3-ketoacyl-CoA thiolase B, peroxisomal [Zancudomyces culisetae]|uniref:3-ketoacyl-CoA thiolase B, peroxisomal n=1 Tax=Zancudomyces culisetae TaxID=1213189 RepID=A0A1R1PJ58_ZANCU|nr:3-ketoacyl-CoA thiolase B, peroxisomal [Zancudomyces culisetae]|eukprot:OMH80996.1 3-ketoacyl-CoA thiolase B, peroxisomal [Zancudomyces culisetae]